MLNIELTFGHNINQLLGKTIPTKLAIAVSGGSDSVALLYIVSNWAKKNNIEVTVLFVDHNLRLESKEEGKYVQQIAQELGHKFKYLSWYNNNSTGNLQELAREARYSLMVEECKKNNIDVLLTAHHRNDLIENFLLRKKRKSGIFGLSTSNITFRDDIKIIRPLFSFFKTELINFLEKKQISWCEDASNQSDKYDRNKLRREIAQYSLEEILWIENQMLLTNKQSEELNQEFIKALAESTCINPNGTADIDLGIFKFFKEQIKINLLNYIVTIISGRNKLPRFRNIEVILESLNKGDKFKRTIHHCQVIVSQDTIIIHREISKISKIPVKLVNGLVWDNRFQFTLNSAANYNYYVHKLENSDLQLLRENSTFHEQIKIIDDFKHKSILFSLPVIKHLEKVVAIPHIFYYDDSDLKGKIKVVFKPNFVSRFIHF